MPTGIFHTLLVIVEVAKKITTIGFTFSFYMY